MDRTKVMVYLSILGDSFPLNEITNLLGIQPTKYYRKGYITKYNVKKDETCWRLSTDYEESTDINNQLKKILDQFEGKEEILLELKKKYSLKFLIYIVMHIEDNDKPLIYFESDTINFLSKIGAQVDFDYYIY